MRHLRWPSLDPNLFDIVEVHVNTVINESIAILLLLSEEFILLINLFLSGLFVFQQFIPFDTELYRRFLMNSLCSAIFFLIVYFPNELQAFFNSNVVASVKSLVEKWENAYKSLFIFDMRPQFMSFLLDIFLLHPHQVVFGNGLA